MGRARRLDPDGGIHHVMNRGVDRQPVFFDDRDRVEFGRQLAEVHTRFGAETLAYCLMTNHFHLLLRLPDGGLSEAMHHLGSVYTRHTNDRLGRDGPLFRGRFRSIPITSDDYLLWVTRYIHRNALDLPGVTSPDAYRWSSYRTYLGHRRTPAFMNVDVVLDHFGGDRGELARFTNDDAERPGACDADELRCLIGLAIASDDVVHGGDDPTPRWLARTVAMLLLDRPIDHRLRDGIAALVPHPSATARRMAMSRARRRLETDPAVSRILRDVSFQLGLAA